MKASPEGDRRGKWEVLMLSRELPSKYSGEVESRMPLETARTGSERGVRATLKRATGPYSTSKQAVFASQLERLPRLYCSLAGKVVE